VTEICRPLNKAYFLTSLVGAPACLSSGRCPMLGSSPFGMSVPGPVHRIITLKCCDAMMRANVSVKVASRAACPATVGVSVGQSSASLPTGNLPRVSRCPARGVQPARLLVTISLHFWDGVFTHFPARLSLMSASQTAQRVSSNLPSCINRIEERDPHAENATHPCRHGDHSLGL